MTETRENRDNIDGKGFLAWLILTGVGTAAGSSIWSLVSMIEDLLGPLRRPQSIVMEIVGPLLPLGVSTMVAALGAGIIVAGARRNKPLGFSGLLVLGAVLGALTAVLMAKEQLALSLLLGIVSGLLAGTGIFFVRRQALRS